MVFDNVLWKGLVMPHNRQNTRDTYDSRDSRDVQGQGKHTGLESQKSQKDPSLPLANTTEKKKGKGTEKENKQEKEWGESTEGKTCTKQEKRRQRLAKRRVELGRELEAFNAHVMQDPRTENLLLPLRDGLLAVRHATGRSNSGLQ